MEYKFLTGVEKWAEELYKAICSVSESRAKLLVSKRPITLPSFEALSKQERSMLKAQYEKFGICLFASSSIPDRTNGHPLFRLVEQLRDDDWLNFPMRHPLEGHPESVKRFGPNDHTFKIYDLSKSPAEGYVEVAETHKEFHTHSDGLGSGGTVQTVVLYCDSPAERGGQFYYYDLIELFKLLYEYSRKTFAALMMDRAITVTRNRGKGAIRVSSPIIYFADDELPGFFYRKPSGEYSVEYANYKLVQEGIQFIEQYAQPGTTCSIEVPFDQPFTGAILNNRFSAHHRNSFVDDASSRLLSRKWYMRSTTHQPYKHIPLILLSERYYKLYPRYADRKYHTGEWLYDSATDSHQIANLIG